MNIFYPLIFFTSFWLLSYVFWLFLIFSFFTFTSPVSAVSLIFRFFLRILFLRVWWWWWWWPWIISPLGFLSHLLPCSFSPLPSLLRRQNNFPLIQVSLPLSTTIPQRSPSPPLLSLPFLPLHTHAPFSFPSPPSLSPISAVTVSFVRKWNIGVISYSHSYNSEWPRTKSCPLAAARGDTHPRPPSICLRHYPHAGEKTLLVWVTSACPGALRDEVYSIFEGFIIITVLFY